MTEVSQAERLAALDAAEAREVADAELFNDFAHTDGTVAAIRARYREKREALPRPEAKAA